MVSNFNYKSIEWKKKRAEILIRDKFLCQVGLPECTVIASQVHHINSVYYNSNIAFADWNLISTCHECHKLLCKASKRSGIIEN